MSPIWAVDVPATRTDPESTHYPFYSLADAETFARKSGGTAYLMQPDHDRPRK